MDDVEESEEDIHGDDFEGVKDNDPDLHVPGAVEAGPCLHNIGFRDWEAGAHDVETVSEYLWTNNWGTGSFNRLYVLMTYPISSLISTAQDSLLPGSLLGFVNGNIKTPQLKS